MSSSVKQAVYGIVFDKSRSKVLLIKRRDVPVWVLPGGGLEVGEKPEEAVIRELYEETGFNVQVMRKVAEYLPVNRLTQLSHFYECQILSGKEEKGSETQDIRFFLIDNLPLNLMPPPYEGWIKDALLDSSQIIRKKIEGVTYLTLIKLLVQHPILVGRFLLTKLGIHINSKD